MAQKNTVRSSDFNLERVSTKQLGELFRTTMSFGGNIAIFGRRGTGKTEIAKQEIAKSDYDEVYINLSVLERVDMGGYPDLLSFQEQRKSFVDFLLPRFYQKLIEGNRKVVALLDEVDKADQSLWAPLLEFTQFRSINGRELPNLQAVIMTGNLQAEGGQRPSLPLLDRAEKYIVEANAQQWLDWAASPSSNIHASVSAYIADHPDHLFGDVDPADRYADPSPRGWHNASKIVSFGEAQGWSSNTLTQKVYGCIGKAVGVQYESYFTHYRVLLPLIDKLFKMDLTKDKKALTDLTADFSKLEPSKQMVAAMIACARLARDLDKAGDGNRPKSTSIVGKFLSCIEPEMALISARSQIGLPRFISNDLEADSEWNGLISKLTKTLEAK